jgi:hypothetical protein
MVGCFGSGLEELLMVGEGTSSASEEREFPYILEFLVLLSR